MYELIITEAAQKDLLKLEQPHLQKRFKAVKKALSYLRENPRHPSLNTDKYTSMAGENGEDMFEAYAENNTPAAYRIFWHYSANKSITIAAITAHP
ncbi:MAG: hypothetical protein K5Q00_01980 [Gammaproteobacteria bacterium]|nr:hypothetical protein [Gammaproteobacteria bacterium]